MLHRICDGIYNPGLRKSLQPDHAAIASPTSLVSHRIVTTMGQMKRYLQFDPLPDDFRQHPGRIHGAAGASARGF